MEQGRMFFIMGVCMAFMQGGYVRRVPHGKEIVAALAVSTVREIFVSLGIVRRGIYFYD
jgi:hypothetical protein